MTNLLYLYEKDGYTLIMRKMEDARKFFFRYAYSSSRDAEIALANLKKNEGKIAVEDDIKFNYIPARQAEIVPSPIKKAAWRKGDAFHVQRR